MDDSKLKAFIFMKVGPYGKECFEDILDRKNCELKGSEKMIFWGYGGAVLNPKTQVQPFVEEWKKEGLGSIEVLMSRTTSNPKKGSNYLGTENCKEKYSTDKKADEKDWKKIPSEICTDSEHALVLDEIRPCHFHLDLQKFKVGARNSSKYGESAADYIKDQTDKGCLVKAGARFPGDAVEVCITYRAYLKHPYAVFLC